MKLYKLVVLGDAVVGKTELIQFFLKNDFLEEYYTTLEDSYRTKVIIDDRPCVLKILDTSGQDEYTAIRDQWIRNGDGFLLVYSVSSHSTFEHVERFRDQIDRVKDTDNVPMILVGNKVHKITEREVSREEGKNMARKLRCEFIECSHETGVNVDRAFCTVVRMIRCNEMCIKCSKNSEDIYGELCKSCYLNYFKKITTRCKNVKLDNLIQQMQLEVEYPQDIDIVFEWIPHNRLEKIKKVDENGLAEVYSALLKDGPLNYNVSKSEYTRTQNEEVLLGYLYNTHDILNDFLDAIMLYKVEGLMDLIKNHKNEIYGISQDSNTKNYIIVYCDNTNVYDKWRKLYFGNSGNEKINNLIQEMQLKINSYNDIVFEWIPYNHFENIKKVGKGGFSEVYCATWKDGPLIYDNNKNEYRRNPGKYVALKCLHNSQNITDEFLNEIKAYSIDNYNNNILKTFGISQNSETQDYIIVLDYAEGGDLNQWIKNNYSDFNWLRKLTMLSEIIKGLKEIHINNMFHRDFHPGNILLINAKCVDRIDVYISDMGLCGKIGNTDKTEIYGVMPYIAPEVLRGKYYTQSADIYSFGIIMYFAVTGRQPFANRAHDHCLILDICNGIRPEINELEAPKCYIELMERCWDSNPDNRPNITEIKKYIVSLYSSYKLHQSNANKIKKYIMYSSYKIYRQFEEAEKYRQKNIKKQSSTHPQAYYTSRLLDPFTKHLSQYINNNELSSKIIIDKEDTYEETILSISLENCKISG